MLLNTPVPKGTDGEDVYVWNCGSSTRYSFSTSQTWDTLRSLAPPVNWYNAVWFKGHIPKHAFLFWIAQLDRMPVMARLARWGIVASSSCTLCSLFTETRDHLLLHSDFSKLVWDKIFVKLGYTNPPFHDWGSMCTWLLTPANEEVTVIRKLATQATTYLLWRERNARIHSGISSTPEGVFKTIDRSIRDNLLAKCRRIPSTLLSRWFTYS
ncbi:uncharacterized protein LOC112082018 [Eutrema salsugineum]|uniref:uncharacterized protein LOC112082018 n=1 Tax=Eutrema salsugineum TaxID=72664 RepID=UPI000CED56A2|nr:uncharacterized protein LOC112082018 [Eutrema salsugineum]